MKRPRVPLRQRLPGISKTPFWLLMTFVQVILLGTIAALHLTVDSLPSYAVPVMLGVEAILVTAMVHFVAIRRLNKVALMMQQDPQVIVGDPACLLQLQRFPWYGVAEVDELQLAVAETYNSYAIDARRMGRTGGVSHSGGDDDPVEWQSACSYEGESDLLGEYLLDQQSGSNPQRRSLLGRMFTPRSSRGSTPVNRRPPGGYGSTADTAAIPVNADGGYHAPGSHSVGATSFKSCISEDSGVTFSEGHLDEHSMTVRAQVPKNDGLNNSSHDPWNDNDAPWSVLHRGLKDPGSSLMMQLLSQVKVGQSLSTVTLPVHILESRSLLEKLSDQYVSWQLLLPLARKEISDPYMKLAQVFKWFISAYRMKPDGAKKPYNPILGESFRCEFAAESPGDAPLRYLAEQVSHHPPVTAIFAECPGLVEVQSVYFPKSKLVSLNCAASLGEGGSIVHIVTTDDRYSITWPSAYVSGIVAGTPRLELGGTVKITDMSSKASAKIEFLRKGYFSGAYDSMKCSILTPEGSGTGMEFHGTWFSTIFQKGTGGAPDKVFHEPNDHIALRPQALPIENHKKVSRGVWRELTACLRNADDAGAKKAKHHVETVQRAERKSMAEAGKVHETQFFSFKGPKAVKDSKTDDIGNVANWRFMGRDNL